MTTVVEDFDCIYLIPIIALISIKIICVASRKNKKTTYDAVMSQKQ